MKEHPIDLKVQAEWDAHLKNVQRLFDASPMRGSKYEGMAFLCLMSAFIPDQFKWEAVEEMGSKMPKIVLIGYCPELHEVLSEEHQKEFAVGSQQTPKVSKRNVN